MTELTQEIGELKEFIAELKADHAAQKEKERREAWTKYTSMSLVFIAVLAAVTMQRSGGYSSRTLAELNHATLYQAQASDQWSYYQAKSIKQNLYEATRDVAERGNGSTGGDSPAPSDAFCAKIAKYEAEKKDIMEAARKLEQQREAALKAAAQATTHGGGMGLAVSIYQIAIALGSICLVTKKKLLWHLSLLLAAAATFKMLWVWLS